MTNSAWSWVLDKEIPSERGAGVRVIETVLGRLEHDKWDSHDIFSVRLALEEAIVNAIKHGNQHDGHKKVQINCRMSHTRLWIKITDEGKGFNPEHVPDPTDPENLEVPSGRGIMLMRSYMTRVEYNDVGNIVEMEKQRASSKEPV